MVKRKTLHIFGGGNLINVAENIARLNDWSVIVRTGKRFVDTIENFDTDTKLLVGDDLKILMREGGYPVQGDIGLSISSPWLFEQDFINKFRGNLFNPHGQPLPKFRGAGGTPGIF